MRVRQKGFNRCDAKWRSFQYAMFIRDINMTHIFRKERPDKVHVVLKRIGVIRW
jgi:uncharacterized C2H2 Zn-finger protein